jgi:hypothetical protein
MDNEEYIPITPKYYNYKGKVLLNNDFIHTIRSYKHVNICAYNINTSGKNPFQQFILTKSVNNTMELPSILIYKDFNSLELLNYTKVCLFGLLNIDDFEKFNELINFNGYYEYNNNLYLFFDITNCKINIDYTYKNSNLWIAILDEIINQKKICSIEIDKEVTDFFVKNSELCFLIDDANNNYEIPVVGYVSKEKSKTNFTYIFGESARDKNSLLGPYFYFTDFNNALQNNGETIIRFALFIGNTKYIQNLKNDYIDTSSIKLQRLQDNNLDKNMEYLTMRISDHDGKWAELYDSTYLGHIILDDETELKNTPIIVLKTYEQQIPLSYHYKNLEFPKNCIQ